MIATLFPSPTLLSVFEDLRRSILEAIGAGRNRKIAKVPSKTSRELGVDVAKALGRLSIKATVPLVFRDAIERRRALKAKPVEAEDLRFEERVQFEPAAIEAPLPLISDDELWARATQPIVDAQNSANEAFKLHAEAGEHIDAATYALEGLLGDLKAVMPGISRRSGKLHKVDFRANRDKDMPAAAEGRAQIRAVRAA